jgi:hypothetical protein
MVGRKTVVQIADVLEQELGLVRASQVCVRLKAVDGNQSWTDSIHAVTAELYKRKKKADSTGEV